MELRAIARNCGQVKSPCDGNPIQNMYLKGKNKQGEEKKFSHLKKGFFFQIKEPKQETSFSGQSG